MIRKMLTSHDVKEIKKLYVKFNDPKSQEGLNEILAFVDRWQAKYFSPQNLEATNNQVISKLTEDELHFLDFLEGLIHLFHNHDEALRNLSNR